MSNLPHTHASKDSKTMKRVRITNSPGRIRLRKDLAEIGEQYGVSISSCPDEASVLVDFVNATGASTPRQFIITVPHYYPHVKPVVKCLDYMGGSAYIATDGEVIHDVIGENWTALLSLRDIVGVLMSIRTDYNIATGTTSLHSVEDEGKIEEDVS